MTIRKFPLQEKAALRRFKNIRHPSGHLNSLNPVYAQMLFLYLQTGKSKYTPVMFLNVTVVLLFHSFSNFSEPILSIICAPVITL